VPWPHDWGKCRIGVGAACPGVGLKDCMPTGVAQSSTAMTMLITTCRRQRRQWLGGAQARGAALGVN
jgi:hypothetical protein